MKSAVPVPVRCVVPACKPAFPAPIALPRRRFLARLAGRCVYLATAAGLAGAARAQARNDSPAVRRVELKILRRKIVGDTNTLRVGAGDLVELVWTSDEAVRLHLHGYNIEAALTAEKPAHMRFRATVSGRFPIAAHAFGDSPGERVAREKILGYLEVYPR